jgi:hypothetical protein
VRFQAARDSLKYLDDQWKPHYDFFETAWTPYETEWHSHVFDFLPPNGDSGYVNGHRYYVRAMLKDSVGNSSEWSETDSLYMDAFPPDDISNLKVTPYVDTSTSQYVMRLTWDAAGDSASGLAVYYLYRRIGDGEYHRIDTIVDATVYDDPCDMADIRTVVCYRVGCRDNVGNVRDWTQTDWEACARVPLGPNISLVCDTVLEEQCYVGGDSAIVCWRDYDTTGVIGYIVRCNDAYYHSTDATGDCFTLPLNIDTLYSIQVRAAFSDGLFSTWSDPQTVIRDDTPPEPVDSLVVVHDQNGTAFLLSWIEPFDKTGVAGYCIQRWTGGGEGDWIGCTSDTAYVDSFITANDTMVAYQNYHYAVCPIDALENMQRNGNAADSDYCNRAPDLSCHSADSLGIIPIAWERAFPNLAHEWYDSVCVRRYGQNDPILCASVTMANSYPFDASQYGSGYYTFRVKEIPLDLQDEKASAWSRPCTAAYDTTIARVADFAAQPQPLLPSEEYDPVGVILISWSYEDVPGLESFVIVRYRDSMAEDTIIVPGPNPTGTYLVYDSGLYAHVDYTYCIKALSEFAPESRDTCITVAIDPYWVYTPRIKPFTPPFFKPDSVKPRWTWIDDSGNEIDHKYGAEWCEVQVCLDTTDTDSRCKSSGWLPAAPESTTVYVMDLVDESNRSLFFRIRARDCRIPDSLLNDFVWSNIYPLHGGWIKTTWDNVPPVPVTGLSIATQADSSAVADTVDVYLPWKPSIDRQPGAGLKHYRVYRYDPDGARTLIDSTDTTHYHDRFYVVNPSACAYRYSVHPVDILNNEQNFGNDTVCLTAFRAPVLRTVSKDSAEWQYEGPADSFYIECSYSEEYLGNRWMKYNPLEARQWVSAEARGCRFDTDSNFIANDTIYFHMKVRFEYESGSFESPWSEVKTYPDRSDLPIYTGNDERDGPQAYGLKQNYPNPFNPTTRISFDLPKSGHVLLRVFNINGQVVRTLIDEVMLSGSHVVEWNGTNEQNRPVASGTYFYQMKSRGFVSSRKMILLR